MTEWRASVRQVVEFSLHERDLSPAAFAAKRGEIVGPGDVDLTVCFGGVNFVPGSRVIADEDGVVVSAEALL